MQNKILYLLFLCLPLFSIGQENEQKRHIDLGLEFQMYPAGIIPGVRVGFGLDKYNTHEINARLGFNKAKRNNWGEHEDERGNGWGGSLAYRYYFKSNMKGFSLGTRADIWNLSIDWRNIGTDEELWTEDDDIGNSKIIIFQPTAEVAYTFLIPISEKQRVFISPNVAFGYELNVKTKGEKVGQGNILLWGVVAGIRF
ncbi:MAG: hypothetical protein ACPG5P_09245 [Saprospiraceae bacterium]